MKNPIELVIDKALEYVRTEDPSWEKAQPDTFKGQVVEAWKQKIETSMAMNTRVLWQLKLSKNRVIGVQAPLFCMVDWHYNPYVVSNGFMSLKRFQQ